MWRSARGGEIHREVTEREQVLREPLPSSRAILWKPLPDSYHLLASMMRAPESQAFLFITQRAFLQVERHLRSGLDLELGGFLAGQLYECPRTRVRYAIVNTVVPFADVSEDPIGSRVTQEAFDTLQKRLIRHRLSLIGWYRNGNGLGLQLLPDDVETHTTYFKEPWQTTMIVVQTASKSKGAFFTYDGRVGRSYCIPFYELFDARAVEAKRVNRTCVNWATYVAATSVLPLAGEEKEIVETTVAPTRAEPTEAEPPEPIDEWWEAITDPWVKLKDAAVKSPSREEQPEPLLWEPTDGRSQPVVPKPLDLEAKPSPAPTPKRGVPHESEVTSRPAAAAPPVAITASEVQPKVVPPKAPVTNSPQPLLLPRVEAPSSAAATPKPAEGAPKARVTPRADAVRAVPPFAGPARSGTGAATPPPTDAVARGTERPASAQAPAKSPSAQPSPPRRGPSPPRPIPRATLEVMEMAAAAHTVGLMPDVDQEEMRWQRRRRIGFTVAAASFLAVILLSTIRARTSGSAQAPPAPVRQVSAAPASPASTPGSATVLTTSGNGDVILALPVAVDSLSGALTYYREIEADHRGGLVGCRVLGRAYQLVGQARKRVDSARSRIVGALDAADSIRVSMLRAEYTHVAQTYQRSGCAS